MRMKLMDATELDFPDMCDCGRGLDWEWTAPIQGCFIVGRNNDPTTSQLLSSLHPQVHIELDHLVKYRQDVIDVAMLMMHAPENVWEDWQLRRKPIPYVCRVPTPVK